MKVSTANHFQGDQSTEAHKFKFVMSGKLPNGTVRNIGLSSDDYEKGLKLIEIFRNAFSGDVKGELTVNGEKV